MKLLAAMGTCNRFSYCDKDVITSVLSQTFKNFDFLIVDNSENLSYTSKLTMEFPSIKILHLDRPRYFRDAVGQVRQAILNHAVSNGYTHLFCLDADCILEKNTIEKLLSHDADFVTAVIGYLHDQKNRTTVYIGDATKPGRLPGQPALKAITFSEAEKLNRLTPIISCGLACYLIKTKFLVGINFFVSHKEMAFLEDRVFCRDISAKGAKLFLDTTVKPIHLHIMMAERIHRLNV